MSVIGAETSFFTGRMDATNETNCSVYASAITVSEGVGNLHKIRLKEFSLALTEGELVFVLGGSGSGKSALIRALAGLSAPDSGEILLSGLPARTLRQKLPLAVTYLSDKTAFHPQLTTWEILNNAGNLRFPGSVDHSIRRAWLQHIIDLTGLTFFMDKKAGCLNAAQRCRLALAEGLVGDPEFLFLDELTRGLDPFTDYELMCCLQTLAHQFKKTIVVSTQQMKSLSICDRILFLHEGRCSFQGTFDQLWETHNIGSSRALFGTYQKASDRGELSRIAEVELPLRPVPRALRSSRPAGFAIQSFALLRRRTCLILRSWAAFFFNLGLGGLLASIVLVAIERERTLSEVGMDWTILMIACVLFVGNGFSHFYLGQKILSKEVRAGLCVSAYILEGLAVTICSSCLQAIAVVGLLKLGIFF